MAELRLVGVHDDGSHLLLSGPDGGNYLLPLDEALRAAVGKSAHASERVPARSSARMTPREIQSMIRSGSSAEQVAEVSGYTIEQIRRYEGPVQAEREYIANQARAVEVAAASPHNDSHRSAFGDEPVSLEEMVRHRLGAFGIDPKSLRWDAWRDEAGQWTVSADFDPGTQRAATSIGEPAPALWRFHAGRKALHNTNRWAQQLSELEPLDSPVPERRLSAVLDQPFDVEANGEASEAELPGEIPGEPAQTPGEPEFPGHGLLDMLRSRRGLRLGIDEGGDDELAAMLGSRVPGAHRPDEELRGESGTEVPESAAVESAAAEGATGVDRLKNVPFLQLAPSLVEHDVHSVERVDSVAHVSTETREVVLSGEPVAHLTPGTPAPAAAPPDAEPLAVAAESRAAEPAHHAGPRAAKRRAGEGARASKPWADAAQPAERAPVENGPSDSEVAERLERKAAAKPKRSSVPSWDEIVFGTKGD